MTRKILFVDDEANLLETYERGLRRHFDLDTASSGELGLQMVVEKGPYAVVITDRQMPNMDGVQFLAEVRRQAPNTVRMILTGYAELETTIQVVNEGSIFRFLTKPCPLDVLFRALHEALDQYALVTSERELLNNTLSGSIKLLTDILGLIEPHAYGRAQALRDLAADLAAKLGLTDPWEVQIALMLASIGYVTVPPETLVKARTGKKLSEPEQQVLDRVPEASARLLANIPRLEGVARMVKYRGKHFDGTGQPAETISGESIPAGARLVRVLLDLMEHRAQGATDKEALDEMQSREGWYDPSLLSALRSCLNGTTRADDATSTTVSLPLKDLTTGMVLRSNIVAKDGTLVLAAGHEIQEMTLERIRNFGLLHGIKEPILVQMLEPTPSAA